MAATGEVILPGSIMTLCCIAPRVRVAPNACAEAMKEDAGIVNDGSIDVHVHVSEDEMASVAATSRSKTPQNEVGKGSSPIPKGGPPPKVETVTQLHAAAVNGDKTMLSRLLATNGKDIDTGDQFGRTPLMFCVLGDRLDCAEILVKAGTLVDKRDKGGRTALHWAGHKGNFRLLKLLIAKGANIREKDNEGQTALHLCTRHKSPKCMALLLKQLSPGEIDDQDKNKRTALHWASSYGNLEHIRMLIKQDSNIGIPDVEGKTPLHWAASSRDAATVNCVKLLLETTPSVINWQDYEGRTALHLSVADGNEDVVTVLTNIENCNVSALDNMFRTPLHWAAVLGHSKIVGMLLDKNADYCSSDSNGATPLHYGAQNNYDDTVAVFLARNVTDEPDVEGRTAFMWAAGKGANDVIKIWLKHGVDIHQVDKNGGTALHAAALSGHATTVKLLLGAGSPINSKDLLKHTPLFRACEIGHTDVVQTLIDCGARVDVLDQDGRSPLHWAALGGHAYICQTLIKYGVDPNIRDQSGRTPLQCAAYGGFVNCMSVLMEHQADPNDQDNEGMTALHWACNKGQLDAVKLLIEYLAFPNHMEFTEDRYTPLDYALMGEHHDVAQYMIEQGALSITGIQDIAAQKIQSAFRGFRVRKTFIERKQLLMKHEHLKKEVAKKRAEEVCKKKDIQNKTDIDEQAACSVTETEIGQEVETQSTAVDPLPEQPPTNPIPVAEEDRGPEPDSDEDVLARHKATREIVKAERERQQAFEKRRSLANSSVSKSGAKSKGSESSSKGHNSAERQAREMEWRRQVAALIIQLAWRTYYRRKLQRCSSSSSTRRKKQHMMWDPDIIAAKQQALLQEIYSEELEVPFWHPALRGRPWLRVAPSPSVTSYNMAVGKYHPEYSAKGNGSRSTSRSSGKYQKNGRESMNNKTELNMSDKLQHVKVARDGKANNKFSYNMHKL